MPKNHILGWQALLPHNSHCPLHWFFQPRAQLAANQPMYQLPNEIWPCQAQRDFWGYSAESESGVTWAMTRVPFRALVPCSTWPLGLLHPSSKISSDPGGCWCLLLSVLIYAEQCVSRTSHLCQIKMNLDLSKHRLHSKTIAIRRGRFCSRGNKAPGHETCKHLSGPEAGEQEARKIPWQTEWGTWDKIIKQGEAINSLLINYKILSSLTKDTQVQIVCTSPQPESEMLKPPWSGS